jgi:hypothetical protein
MKKNPTPENSDYNLSFWFVALWPLICVAIVVIGFLAGDVIKTLMKARQLELRAIPQFDSGRWKLRLERVPVDPDHETTMGMDFDSAAQASVNETNEAHWFLLPIARGRRER